MIITYASARDKEDDDSYLGSSFFENGTLRLRRPAKASHRRLPLGPLQQRTAATCLRLSSSSSDDPSCGFSSRHGGCIVAHPHACGAGVRIERVWAISSQLAKRWRPPHAADKEPFQRKVGEAVAGHRRKYPDYVHNPREASRHMEQERIAKQVTRKLKNGSSWDKEQQPRTSTVAAHGRGSPDFEKQLHPPPLQPTASSKHRGTINAAPVRASGAAHGKKTAPPPPPPSGKDTCHFPALKTDGAAGARASTPQHGKQLDAEYKKQIDVLRAQNELLLNKIKNLESKLSPAAPSPQNSYAMESDAELSPALVATISAMEERLTSKLGSIYDRDRHGPDLD
ncbi:hypothetical protein HPB49_013082 [Dermacentor silvarum]|uniref:Uncharacterized protein n=1 Tax=Dermacentor silvarum TaxID=543639 RepID=A0ACB8DZQ8_DERSI|nr:hypothetical protein HPB49_013082 [Dermacentor silvarum]